MVAAVDRVVDRPLDQDRDRERQPREDERAGEPDRDQPPLRPPEREEVAQGRPELQIGRVDVLHARVGLLAAGRAGHAVGGQRVAVGLEPSGERRRNRPELAPRRSDSARYQPSSAATSRRLQYGT